MSLDFDATSDEESIADSVRRFCSAHRSHGATRGIAFSKELWREFAELGILGLVSDAGLASAPLLVAAAIELGRAAFPGPFVQTIAVAGMLENSLRERIVSGQSIVAFGTAGLLAWAPLADVCVEVRGTMLHLVEVVRAEMLDTLGEEPWARVSVSNATELGDARPALDRYNLALAAYLVGAGRGLVEIASEHAKIRRQFGQTIGEFQAISHPLAEAQMELEATDLLVRAAASLWECDPERAGDIATLARLGASKAARKSVYRGHQTLGAMGATRDGPIYHISRRVQQSITRYPDDRVALARCARTPAVLI